VRVLAWVSFAIMDSNLAEKSGAGSIARVNAFSMDSVKQLRAHPKLVKKGVLNVISHTAGAVHNKLVVIGNDTNAVGFTGGIDFQFQRIAHLGHPGFEVWHDVMAKVEGEAVQAMYDHFQHMWQENIKRPVKKFRYAGADLPSFVPGTPVIPARTLTLADPGTKHHVQILRTIPQFNYKWYNCLPENSPISYAPSGIFEYKMALRKAIRAAISYIYIEDQSYWSQEILGWANEAIKLQANLRVILLFPGGADPVDGEQNDAAEHTQSINHGLLAGLSAEQLNQVRLFRSLGDINLLPDNNGNPASVKIVSVAEDGENALVTLDINAAGDMSADRLARKHLFIVNEADTSQKYEVVGNPAITKGFPRVWRVSKGTLPDPPPGTYFVAQRAGIFVHAKTVLVDDVWAVIGSGNVMRRSLYTDLEHGVSFMDEDGAVVRNYRCRLWADHFRYPTPDDFADLNNALHAWDPSWGTAGPLSPPLAPWLEAIPIPVAEVAFTDKKRTKYDDYNDVSSRQEWGGLCPALP
jgi:phosphatidylserine/phosphatidylglycerophosphate/cardiolipin synthase-like enzyme